MKLSEKIKKYKESKAICKTAKEEEYNKTVKLLSLEKDIKGYRYFDLDKKEITEEKYYKPYENREITEKPDKVRTCLIIHTYQQPSDPYGELSDEYKEGTCCENFLLYFSPPHGMWSDYFTNDYILIGQSEYFEWEEAGGDFIAVENEKCNDCPLKEKRENFVKALKEWEKSRDYYYDCRENKRECFKNIFKVNTNKKQKPNFK
jgi:hypothetical protein